MYCLEYLETTSTLKHRVECHLGLRLCCRISRCWVRSAANQMGWVHRHSDSMDGRLPSRVASAIRCVCAHMHVHSAHFISHWASRAGGLLERLAWVHVGLLRVV